MVEDDKWMTYFGAKPQTMYVSQEAYDELVRRINEQPRPRTNREFEKTYEPQSTLGE